MNRKLIKQKLRLVSGSTRMVFFFWAIAIKIPRLDLGVVGFIEGLKSNREEDKKWREAYCKEDCVITEILCPVRGIYCFGFFLLMDKAERFLYAFEWKKWQKTLKVEKYHKWFNDVTSNNVMILNNKVVMVDYAYHRKAEKGGYKP